MKKYKQIESVRLTEGIGDTLYEQIKACIPDESDIAWIDQKFCTQDIKNNIRLKIRFDF